ncbi:hypothetical protein SteCoe_18514 [Stentor coeruleus]|uniref:Ion transport domain-containing protein n=1 Tax=Stentor coeruleus TaxID=5963 RepID=A0A1R2BWM2_9CILI|nr:hypothetical protein SteCoe_18514 [Stentor coeruleus]
MELSRRETNRPDRFSALRQEDYKENPFEETVDYIKSLWPQDIIGLFCPRFVVQAQEYLIFANTQGKMFKYIKDREDEFDIKTDISCICVEIPGSHVYCGDLEGNVYRMIYGDNDSIEIIKTSLKEIIRIKANEYGVVVCDKETVICIDGGKERVIGKYDLPCICIVNNMIIVADMSGVIDNGHTKVQGNERFTEINGNMEVVIVGCYDGKVIIKDLNSLDKVWMCFYHKDTIVCLSLDDDGVVVAGSKDTTISVWRWKDPLNYYTCNFVSNAIGGFTGTNDDLNIVSVLSKNNNAYVCFNGSNSKKIKLSLGNGQKVLPQPEKIKKIMKNSQSIVLIFDCFIKIFDILTFTEKFSFTSEKIFDSSLCSMYLSLLTQEKIIILPFPYFTPKAIQVKNILYISISNDYFYYSSANELIITKTSDPSINLEEKPIPNIINLYTDKWNRAFLISKKVQRIELFQENFSYPDSYNITHLTSNESYLIGMGVSTIIWNKNSGYPIFSISTAIPQSIWTKKNYFYMSSGDILDIWDLRTFTKILEFKVHCSSCISNKKHIIYSYNNNMIVKEHPFYTNEFDIYSSDKYSFIQFFMNIYNNPVMNELIHWSFISPYRINSLLIIIYYNLSDLAKVAIKQGAPMISTSFGNNALDLALSKDFLYTVDCILLALGKKSKENPFVLQYVEHMLIDLNFSNCKELPGFYDSLIGLNTTSYGEKFVNAKLKLPKLGIEDTVEPNIKKGKYKGKGKGKAVKYYTSLIRVASIAGSKESKEFTRSLAQTSNEEILESDFVKLLLSYKWNQVKFYLYFQAVLYLIYMVILSLYVCKALVSTETIISIFLINLVFTLWQCIQMYGGGTLYWEDQWNYLDLARSAMVMAYVLIVALKEKLADNNSVKTLLVFIVLISWIRGINYFRLFNMTRYMVNLIKQVIKDSMSFLIIFFYSTIAFGFIYFALEEGEPDEIDDYLIGSYLLNMLDYSSDEFKFIEWCAFFLVTMINSIIILCLLIAVFGETFYKVNEAKTIADYRELSQLIYEGEVALFRNYYKTQMSYLHYITDKPFSKPSDLFSTQLHLIKQKIKKMSEYIITLTTDQKSTSHKVDLIYSKMSYLFKSITDLEKKIK